MHSRIGTLLQSCSTTPSILLIYTTGRMPGQSLAKAEKMFVAAGDQRNALYAKLGRIRSTVEQGRLPVISAQLGEELNTNPLLLNDKQLRMFCFIVKGDIDAELNSGAMRDDWEQVQALARELDNTKWQYRALAQLGLVAFYEGDLATARKNVGSALAAATAAGDAGAQIRYLTELGIGFGIHKDVRAGSPLSRQGFTDRHRHARFWLSISDLRAALGRTDRP